MKRLIPDSIAARTLLVLIVGLTVSHILSVALYITDRTSAVLFTGGEHTGERIVTIHRLVKNASSIERQRIVELADHPNLHVSWNQESAINDQPEGGWKSDVLRRALTSHVDTANSEVVKLRQSVGSANDFWRNHLHEYHQDGKLGEALLASLQLSDGSWLNFAAPIESPQPFWSLRFALSIVVMVVAVAILSALIVHHLTKPLAAFARAAHRLGVDVKAPPLPEEGPAEVRQAVRAFNEMQDRIRRFVEDRTQMVAAISHDLGTPITRMRLRAEFVDDDEQKTKMLADLDDMEKMVFSALSFARDEAAYEQHAMVDLATLLHRVCNDLSDAGHTVRLDCGDGAVPYACRPVALRRALSNLVENAVKYGKRARVSLNDNEQIIFIKIDDDGPGIPEDLQAEAFKPFHRLEISRNRGTGGTGLGLTVARTIIRGPGGGILLQNRPEGGLRAEVTLPRQRA